MPTRRIAILFAVINTLLLAATGFVLVRGRTSADPWHGTRLDPPLAAASFELVTAEGALQADDLHGRHTVLFFGYMRCPDACPTTLTKLARVLTALGTGQAEKLRVVLVSVDPAHDTAARVAAYVRRFDARFLGATGEPAAIQAMTRAYGIHNQVTPRADVSGTRGQRTGPTAGGAHAGTSHASADSDPHFSHAPTGRARPALIDHTAHILLLDPDGRLVFLWGPEVAAEHMTADLRRLLRE